IVELSALTPMVNRVVFEPKEFRPYMAGQHIDIRLTAPDGYRAERSYSITSAPSAPGRYELAIELLTGGEVSTFFHGYAKVGTEIEIRGPLGGHFIWEPSMPGDVVLLGAGSGVAPFISMAREHTAAKHGGRMLLLHSSRSNMDVVGGEELAALASENPRLTYIRAITRDRPERDGDLQGRFDCDGVLALMRQHAPQAAGVFVCGSNAFVEALAGCFVDAGIDADRVKTERFGG
ncbi:MAG: hypothetical protein KDE03_17305, partial [Rhodobacteraceae bacterium]|nr:hypothetical protein [Paracoccaceae bacterium]